MLPSCMTSFSAPLLLLMVEIITRTFMNIPTAQSSSSNGLFQTIPSRKQSNTAFHFHPKQSFEAATRKAASSASSSSSCKPAICRNPDNVKISCAGSFTRCSHATKYDSPLIQCDGNDNSISFNLFLTTDAFGGETYFILGSSTSGAIDQIGPREFPDQSSFHISSCLPSDSCYNFTIADLSRDGMCCNGDSPSDVYSGYELIINGNTIAAGGAFQFSATHYFGSCSTSSATTKPPIQKPITEAPATSLPTTGKPITFKPTRKPSTQKPSVEPTNKPSTKHPVSARPTSAPMTKQPISLKPTTIQPSTQQPTSLKPTIQPPTKQPIRTKRPSTKQMIAGPTVMRPSGIIDKEHTIDKPTVATTSVKSPTNMPTTRNTTNKMPVPLNVLSGNKSQMYCPWDIPVVIASSENVNNQTQILRAELLFQYYILLPSTQTNATPDAIKSDVLPALKRTLLTSLKNDCSKHNNNTYLFRRHLRERESHASRLLSSRVLESNHGIVAVGAFPSDEVVKNESCPRGSSDEENRCFVIQGKVTVFSSSKLDLGWAQKSFIAYANETMTSSLAGVYGNFAVTEIQMMDAGPTTTLQQENEATRARSALISLPILGVLSLILIAIVLVHQDRKKKMLSDGEAQSAEGLQKPMDKSKYVNDICNSIDDKKTNIGCTKVIQQGNLINCQEATEGNGIEVSMTVEAEARLSAVADRPHNSATETRHSVTTREGFDVRSHIENSRVILNNAWWLRRKKIENDDGSLLTSAKKRTREGFLASIFHRNEGIVSRSPSYDFSDAKSNSSTVEEDQLQYSSQSPSLKTSSFRTYNRPQVGATPLCYEVGDEIHEYNNKVLAQGAPPNAGTPKGQNKRVSWAKNVVVSRISPPTTSSSTESSPTTYPEQNETAYIEEKSEGFSNFNFKPPSCELLDAAKYSNKEHPSRSMSNRHGLPHKKVYQEENEKDGIVVRASTDQSFSVCDGSQQNGLTFNSNASKSFKRRITIDSLFPLLSSIKTKSPPAQDNGLPLQKPNNSVEAAKTLQNKPHEIGTTSSNLISSRRHDEDGFTTFVFESSANSTVTETILL